MQHHTESQRSIQSGPSELYRLIASNKYQWDVILQRCTTHPHEACFYDTNAGGHVYALHRLLRHTGNDDDDSNIDIEQQSNTRPPVEVVEAVLLACPRAITRKQALLNEDDLMMQYHAAPDGTNNNNMDWQPNNLNGGGNQHQGAAQEDNGDDDNEEDAQQNEDEEEDNLEHDEVRYEYPLAIACECQQDCDVVRLLASYLSKSDPAYRSEVFRSLDYASLSSEYVRILLEEYSGGILERGTNSEVTEGDDDDSPLEQILFWWDDPDMLNMEEDISLYPNCTMQHDLCDLYSKLSMMLYAATKGSMVGYDKSKRTFQVLHYLLHIVSDGGLNGVQFPNDFAHSVLLLAKFIQRARSFQFEERDESGSLPLHIVVSGTKLLKPNIPRIESNEEGDDMAVEVEQDDDIQPENDVQVNEMGQAGDQQQHDNNPIEPQVPPVEQDEEADQDDGVDEEDEDEDEMADDEDDNQEEASMDIDYGLEIVKLLLDQHPSSIRLRDSLSGSLPVHLALCHNPLATEAIEHFLDLYPIAVTMPDGNGRLPLHLALIQGSPSWRSILSLSPTKIETRDPITGLLPFQLAAMSKSKPNVLLEKDNLEEVANEAEGELESLSTCFSLLRMSPCLASGLDNSKQSSQAIMGQQFMMKYKYKPRVTKLEEENERLRQKVEELEAKLQMLQMKGPKATASTSIYDTQPTTCYSPQNKKRKP